MDGVEGLGQMSLPLDNCPHCGTDLRGDPIPDMINGTPREELYGPTATHYKREIGYYSRKYDRTMHYVCPDCGSLINRDGTKKGSP
jgi:predicted RNA-binding Zn-ribbon protein involved in translation (DUF1610 family)